MKILAPLLIASAAVSSCTMGPPAEPMARTAKEQAQFASLTAGKVAGAPLSCLTRHRSRDMIVIDENTIAFRDGAKRLYVNHMQGGGCMNIDHGRNALVTQNPTGSLCRGDIAQVVDTLNRIPVGSCVFGDFVPYMRPGA